MNNPLKSTLERWRTVCLHSLKLWNKSTDTVEFLRKKLALMNSNYILCRNEQSFLKEIHKSELEKIEDSVTSSLLLQFVQIIETEKNLVEKTAISNFLEKYNVEWIEPEENERYDPKLHETVNESENDQVLRTLRRGITFKGKILRASLVELKS